MNLQKIDDQDYTIPNITWNVNTRFVTYNGNAIMLSLMRAKIFDKIYEATKKNGYATLIQLVEAAYHGQADGGPEEAESSIKVSITRMRAQLQSIGLNITSALALYAGYRLTIFHGDKYAMAAAGERFKKYSTVPFPYKPKTQEQSAVEAMDKCFNNRNLMGNAD